MPFGKKVANFFFLTTYFNPINLVKNYYVSAFLIFFFIKKIPTIPTTTKMVLKVSSCSRVRVKRIDQGSCQNLLQKFIAKIS